MGATSSLTETFRMLPSQELLVPALTYSILSLPTLLQSFSAQASSGSLALEVAYAVFLWLIAPFFTAGIMGVALEARRGNATISTFFQFGRSRYLSLLIATVVVIIAVLGVVMIALLGSILAYLAGRMVSEQVAVVAVVLFLLLFGMLVIVAAVLFSFYDACVVVEDSDPLSAFTCSMSFVRSNLVHVIAFFVLAFAVFLLFSVPNAVAMLYYVLTSLPEFSMGMLESEPLPRPEFGTALLVILGTIITNTLVTAFMPAYKAVFYSNLRR
ncbi:MAG: hypothetical protein GXN98_04710 [Euryarchaeota archaeon]|nr:hypothetical protein [Euryarchaeota archaeon]